MVAVRDDVGAGGAQLPGDLAGETGAARSVLAVHDAQIDRTLAPDARRERRERLPPRPTDDVADEESSHAARMIGAIRSGRREAR